MTEPLAAPPAKSESAPRDLLYDPEAMTCARLPVFRHPLYRKLRPVCYLGMPALLILSLFVCPPQSFALAVCGSALLLSLVWLSLLLPQQHGRLAAACERNVRAMRGLRFLCPSCLHFGPVRHACGACGAALEPFVIHTRGLYLNDCAHCRAHIYPTSWAAGTPPSARCGGCGSMFDASLHGLRVRVIGVLNSADLEAFGKVVVAQANSGRGAGYLYQESGTARTYVLDVDGVAPGAVVFPERHAARAVEALWLDAVLEDPLRLGEALDRFLRRAGISEARRMCFPVFVAERELSPAVRNVLAARFGEGVVTTPPERVLGSGKLGRGREKTGRKETPDMAW